MAADGKMNIWFSLPMTCTEFVNEIQGVMPSVEVSCRTKLVTDPGQAMTAMIVALVVLRKTRNVGATGAGAALNAATCISQEPEFKPAVAS